MSDIYQHPIDRAEDKIDQIGHQKMENVNREVWSALDAASEKMQITDRISIKAMNAIQGVFFDSSMPNE